MARKPYGSGVRDGTPVFVGIRQFVVLRTDELPMCNESCNLEIGASSFRSVLFLNHGPSGVLSGLEKLLLSGKVMRSIICSIL